MLAFITAEQNHNILRKGLSVGFVMCYYIGVWCLMFQKQ